MLGFRPSVAGLVVGLSLAALLVGPSAARAERTIYVEHYRDKLRGMWLGQIVGNFAGRPVEGQIRRGGLDYTIDWEPPESFLIGEPGAWDADDDTVLEFMYAHELQDDPGPSDAELATMWTEHVPSGSFYIANRQARWLMDLGYLPPQTGSIHRNAHWYAIDSQITTEAVGALCPGLAGRSTSLTGQLAQVTNDGFAAHAAQFYAAMYAHAAFESDVEAIVADALNVVPQTSYTRQIVEHVVELYEDDLADDGLLDWRASQRVLYDRYYGSGDFGRYRNWIESAVNTAMTTLAVLYGQGDYKQTVEIGVQAGFDGDCNPATAGGLIGLIGGYSQLPSDVTDQATDGYTLTTLTGYDLDQTVSGVADRMVQATEAQILASGGSASGEGVERMWHVPDDDPLPAMIEKPDPAGPRGLVGAVRAAAGAVTTSASIENHNPSNDRENLDAIADGIVDLSYNGRVAYWTKDGWHANAQPAGGDFYQLTFSRPVTFSSVIFWEGNIELAHPNANPRTQLSRGGWFEDLRVEVDPGDGNFVPVELISMSEPLDSVLLYQDIELLFEPIEGVAVRVIGQAGGTHEYTTCVELEAFGLDGELIGGDATLDGEVDVTDLAILAASWGDEGSGDWYGGDFSRDGNVDVTDLAILAANWGASGGKSVPEPGSAALVASGWCALVAARRRRR